MKRERGKERSGEREVEDEKRGGRKWEQRHLLPDCKGTRRLWKLLDAVSVGD